MYTISSDKAIYGVDQTGNVAFSHINAHSDPINKIIPIDVNTMATGDDSGCVKIWDNRLSRCAIEYHVHQDYVAGFLYSQEERTLLSVGGDATLCAYDLRKKNSHQQSDEQESEINCVQSIKHGKKVICGTQEGVLLIFSWNRWGDCSDRFPGHPETINCLLKIDEETLVTGSDDGLIRLITIQPNKVLGILGDHETFPVEGLRRSIDGTLLCSFAHDEIVRFFDLSILNDDDADDDNLIDSSNNDYIDNNGDVTDMDTSNNQNIDEEAENEDDDDESMDDQVKVSDSGGDMDEDEDEDDSDSDSDNIPNNKNAGGKRTIHIPTAAQKFFSDL